MNQLLAIGLDGGDLEYLLARRQQLPNIAELLNRGAVTRIEPPECLSGSVWPTFSAGLEPGEHGIYQHLVWDPQRMGLRRISPEKSYSANFWAPLEAQGVRSIVVDIPYCFPSGLQRGVEVFDWGTHGQTLPTATNTPEVAAFMRTQGRSSIGREAPIQKGKRQLARIEATLQKSVKEKTVLLKNLLNNFDWDLGIAIYAETHRAGHIFHSELDRVPSEGGQNHLSTSKVRETPLLRVYQAIDRDIGQLVEEFGAQAEIALFSVHGMTRDFNQSGLVTEVMNRLNAHFLGQDVTPPKRGLVHRLRASVPPQLQLYLADIASDSLRQWIVEREMIGGIDWAQTPGFALRTDIRSEIRLNLIGRERCGILEPGSSETDRYIALLREVFHSLTDVERGDQLVNRVVPIGEVFPGPNSSLLPDFAIEWHDRPLARHIRSKIIGDIHLKPLAARGGDHRDQGFVVHKPAPSTLTLPERVSDLGRFFGDLTLGKKG